MKAVVWKKYGGPDVLELKEFNKPSPRDNEVLIKVFASTVTAADSRLRASRVPFGFWFLTRLVFGLFTPRKKVLGMDVSGEIESVGKNITLFKKGDAVYGSAGMSLGTNAEYICLSEKAALVLKPASLTHEQAASIVFGGVTAWHFLKDRVGLQRGIKLLVNGASGAVGTAAVQMGNYFGAEVTGVCSGSNVELVSSLGAKNVVDYTVEDIFQGNKKYDVILDAVGSHSTEDFKNILESDGKLILLCADMPSTLASIFHKNILCGVAEENKLLLNELSECVAAGGLKPVIDNIYPLEQTAAAHRYVDLGRKKGSVVISVTH